MKKLLAIFIASVLGVLVIHFVGTFFEFYRVDAPKHIALVHKKLTWFDDYTYHPFLSYYKHNELQKPRDPQKFNIAIVGGSFADQMFSVLKKKYKNRLANIFSKNSDQVELYNFAAGGYAQPMQWILLSLYSENIDLVLSVEGYNELFLDTYTCLPRDWATMSLRYGPANMQSRYSVSGKLLKSVYLGLYDWNQKNVFYDAITRPFLFMSANGIAEHIDELGMLHTKSVAREICHHDPPNADELYKERLQLWFKHLNLMTQLPQMKKNNVFVFFQPNLHYKISKELTKEEQQLVQLEHRSEDINKWYDTARTRFSQLESSNFIDLTMAYKESQDTLYNDSCCHVNDMGRELVVRKMLDMLEQRRQK